MQIITILIATFAATSTMTLFSYMLSESFRKLYKEPVLLEYVIKGLGLNLASAARKTAGWIIHYLIGLLFVIGYHIFLIKHWFTVSWQSGLLFGSIIGIIGILGWQVMFKLSKGHIPVNRKEYYMQLFLAHLIFGLTSVGVYAILMD